MREASLLRYGCSTRVLGPLNASNALKTEKSRARSPGRALLTNLTPGGDPGVDGPHQGTRVNCQRQGPRARLRPTAALCDLLPPELDKYQSRPAVPSHASHQQSYKSSTSHPERDFKRYWKLNFCRAALGCRSLARSTPAPCDKTNTVSMPSPLVLALVSFSITGTTVMLGHHQAKHHSSPTTRGIQQQQQQQQQVRAFVPTHGLLPELFPCELVSRC